MGILFKLVWWVVWSCCLLVISLYLLLLVIGWMINGCMMLCCLIEVVSLERVCLVNNLWGCWWLILMSLIGMECGIVVLMVGVVDVFLFVVCVVGFFMGFCIRDDNFLLSWLVCLVIDVFFWLSVYFVFDDVDYIIYLWVL